MPSHLHTYQTKYTVAHQSYMVHHQTFTLEKQVVENISYQQLPNLISTTYQTHTEIMTLIHLKYLNPDLPV